MTKFEVTDDVLDVAEIAYDNQSVLDRDERHHCYRGPMRAAISAALEASGLVERIAELEAGEKQMAEQWNRLQDLLGAMEKKAAEHGIQLIDWQEFLSTKDKNTNDQ